MRAADVIDFVLLSALWGASFLFMRMAAPDFGPVPLMLLRCGIGALTLLPILIWRGAVGALRNQSGHVGAVGVLNSAIPFTLLAGAALSLSAGTLSILNATAPFWGAVVGYLWLRERLTMLQTLGLLIGFTGVYLLVAAGPPQPEAEAGKLLLAVGLALGATFFYGVSANYTKRFLANTNPLVNATGSQLAASTVLLLPGLWLWPAVMPGTDAWVAVVLLGVFCTGLAYLLFFRLIRNLGPIRAITVTFAIPAFGMLWGALVLDEQVNLGMIAGAAIVVIGCALTTRVIRV